MLIDCLLHQFLGSIQERVHIPCRVHVVNELKGRWTTCVFAWWLSRLLREGLTVFEKRCWIIFQTSFTSSAPTPRSFIIFSKSARESHTLPPAKLLQQNSTGLASGFCVRSTFDIMLSNPLSSDVYLTLSTWNSAKLSLSAIHSAHVIGERSNFLTPALHLFSVDGSTRPFQSTRCSTRPFQSTRCRYSCIRNWVVQSSPCTLGTSTRTLCSPFDVVDNLSCGGRSWCAFKLKPYDCPCEMIEAFELCLL